MDFTVATERHRLRQLLVRPHANVTSGLELTRCLPWELSSHEFFMGGSNFSGDKQIADPRNVNGLALSQTSRKGG